MSGLIAIIIVVGIGYIWLAQAPRETSNSRRERRKRSWQDWVKNDD